MGLILHDYVREDCLEEAREAFEKLKPEQKQIVDAAIIKKLNRSAYEASLRIYETRNGRRFSNLVDIFDGIVRDYTDPEKITLLRSYMIGVGPQDGAEHVSAAEAELADINEFYTPGTIRPETALRLAAEKGIRPEAFEAARAQLSPVSPLMAFVARAT